MKRIKEANADDSALEDKYYRYVFSKETLATNLFLIIWDEESCLLSVIFILSQTST
jgi:hypothetical protein